MLLTAKPSLPLYSRLLSLSLLIVSLGPQVWREIMAYNASGHVGGGKNGGGWDGCVVWQEEYWCHETLNPVSCGQQEATFPFTQKIIALCFLSSLVTDEWCRDRSSHWGYCRNAWRYDRLRTIPPSLPFRFSTTQSTKFC